MTIDLFAPKKKGATCAECAKGGVVYQMTCDSCFCRWFWRLPRKFKATAWKSRPDLHDRLREEAAR